MLAALRRNCFTCRIVRRQHKALAIHPARATPTLAPHISGAAYCEVRGLEEGSLQALCVLLQRVELVNLYTLLRL
jgi:hypothetical protein